MSNFNTMNSGSSENRDNPWVVDSAERDREKPLAERLAEAGVDNKILNSDYLKDVLNGSAQIESFDVSKDGKELVLKGDTELKEEDIMSSVSSNKTDRTISLLDNGGMAINEKHSSARAFEEHDGPNAAITTGISLYGERRVSKSILNGDGDIVHYESTRDCTPIQERKASGFPNELRKVVEDAYFWNDNYYEDRREVRADVDGGYVNVTVRDWDKKALISNGLPTAVHNLRYPRDSRDEKYELHRTVGSDLDMKLAYEAEQAKRSE